MQIAFDRVRCKTSPTDETCSVSLAKLDAGAIYERCEVAISANDYISMSSIWTLSGPLKNAIMSP